MAPRANQADADEADRASPAAHHILLRAEPRRPHDLVAGDAHLGRFLQGRRGTDANGAQDDPVGFGDLDPQPGRLLVEPRRLHGQVLHHKAVGRCWASSKGMVSRPYSEVVVDMGDFWPLSCAISPAVDR